MSSTPLSNLPPHTVQTLFTEEQIQQRVAVLGADITRDFPELQRPLLLVGILKGAAVFLADLCRAIARPVEYDFVELSSYGSGTMTSGTVTVIKDITADVIGKDVLVVEDILDSGLTLNKSRLLSRILERGAASVGFCVLLDKPSRRQVDVPVDYRGFSIENLFVVGYGMDYDGQYRNLNYIGTVHHNEG